MKYLTNETIFCPINCVIEICICIRIRSLLIAFERLLNEFLPAVRYIGTQYIFQILFLTTSSEPYKATRPFIKIHDKFITIPLTDYNTLYMFYKDLLMKYHGVDRNIDVSSMAKMSVGIPLEFIRDAVKNVLNLHRRITLKIKPLTVSEIMEEVLKYEPPQAKTLSELTKFENHTPLGKKRARLLATEKAARERIKKLQKARR